MNLTWRDRAIAFAVFAVVLLAAGLIVTHRDHNQHDAEARHDLIALAALEAQFLQDNPSGYGTTRELVYAPYNFRGHGEAIAVTGIKTNISFCLRAHSRSGRDYYYDSTIHAILPPGQTC